MRRQRAARYRYQLLLSEASRDCKCGNDEEETANQHVESERQVVPGRIGIQTGKRTAIVTGATRIGIQDLRETMSPTVVGISNAGTWRIPIPTFGERPDRTQRCE